MVNVSIIGATGYVGLELLRLLVLHPEVKIKHIVSQSYAGKKVWQIYPSLKNVLDLELINMDLDLISMDSDIVFTSLPHGVSMDVVPTLIAAGNKVIDMSGDFRYKSKDVYESWYKLSHKAPELLETAVYGLVELNRDKIAKARLVANPGCYPTCSVLALAPLLSKSIIKAESIIINAASGVTGAGRTLDTAYLYCESDENFRAYKATDHRHTSEIEQELSIVYGKEVNVSFTPHLLPMKRGMLATIHADLNVKCSNSEILLMYNEFYKDEHFVRIQEEGVYPETKCVSGSNFIDIGMTVDGRLNRVVVMSVIDNIGKGAASQAIQSLNVMCGLEETMGLGAAGMYL